MPCYHPLHGWRSRVPNRSGKRSIVFTPNQGYIDLPVVVPCGQCIGCRLERSRQWAIRCVHESSLYTDNTFLTLTYSPENLPKDSSLVHSDFQKFMKLYRRKYGNGIRYFMCGEYGDQFQRPHYHACIFNHDLPDKKLHKQTDLGHKLYGSMELDKLWKKGIARVGGFSFETAAYVARYVTKKVTGAKALDHYNLIDPYGEILKERRPEYAYPSKGGRSGKGGIGREWFEKYIRDVYPDDFIVLNRGGHKLKPPRFYDKLLEKEYPTIWAIMRAKRKEDAELNAKHNSPDRRLVREEIQLLKYKQLVRRFENDLEDVHGL